MSETGKDLIRSANGWWKCAQYFVIVSCGKMSRSNRCMYMAHVCFYICCNDYVGSVDMECFFCVAAVVS